MKKIITIGGGGAKETIHIDEEVVRLTGKKNPQLLFIPTANSDISRYVKYIKTVYEKLGCTVEPLLLLKKKYTPETLKNLILTADIIYVGGGNTLMMMKKWRQLGVDLLLKKAWEQGAVMTGVSAGSICWYESGHSDSMHFYNPKKWDYIRVHGLNFIPFIHCPHYDSQTGNKKRKTDFKRMMRHYPNQIGIACDDGVAIEYLDDKYRVLSAKSSQSAYRVYWKKGEYVEEKLENTGTFLPIINLKKTTL